MCIVTNEEICTRRCCSYDGDVCHAGGANGAWYDVAGIFNVITVVNNFLEMWPDVIVTWSALCKPFPFCKFEYRILFLSNVIFSEELIKV